MQRLALIFRFVADLVEALPRAKAATRDGGVSVPRQIYELIRLHFGKGKLSVDDYYLMCLYREDLSFSEKSKYLSNFAMGVIARDRRWGVVADDKILTYSLLLSQGVKIPSTLAIVHPVRSFGERPALRSRSEVEDYLINNASYPFFSKPVQGIYSKDALLVEALDRNKKTIMLGDGSSLPLQQYVEHCFESPSGHLIQELLRPHADIEAVCGDRLCTVRMIVMLADDGPRLFCALWKIAGGENMADNYWRKGNMLASLDRQHGTVRRCTTGLGPELREIDRHPTTNQRLVGFTLPCWDEAVDTALDAARAVPGLPIQAWDIALTSNGPMALEVNVFGSLFLPQIANQEGLYQGEFREFMEKNHR